MALLQARESFPKDEGDEGEAQSCLLIISDSWDIRAGIQR